MSAFMPLAMFMVIAVMCVLVAKRFSQANEPGAGKYMGGIIIACVMGYMMYSLFGRLSDIGILSAVPNIWFIVGIVVAVITFIKGLRAGNVCIERKKNMELSAGVASEPAHQTDVPTITCWVFGCYDKQRVQAMAMVKANFYSEANVVSMVRQQLNIPAFVRVTYVEPITWNAPDIISTADSFNCDMDDIDYKVNAYIVQTGYSEDKTRNAIKTTMPYPNAGLLLIIVNI
jgi:hypothetical protein